MRTPLETHLTTGGATAASLRGGQQGSSRAQREGEGNLGLMAVLETGTDSGDRGDTFTPTPSTVLADNSVSMGRPENLPLRLPNLSTGYNALSTTLAVVTEVPEHTASDAQLSVSVLLEETGSKVNSLPGTSDPLNSAHLSPSHSQTEDFELRAIFLSHPTKQDLALLPNRGDLEAVALHLEGALQKEITEVWEQLDIVETRVSNLICSRQREYAYG